ncbi:MAG TPA: dihydrolipoyl dehydrogenase [Kiritimatiellia bacterium]|nr:dihydrolipoyl dehydrogenase [Kiritimatiellia bacterium]HMO97707.1 dihydrolipoyl dehydrogenase [Kiritimatiellia bacterium]HMP97091.1 dihydrolipoyl dehydrogenase [Kiritimatiellia bacterium]
MTTSSHSQIVIIGGGPGGYPAAFQASDMGFQVSIIELEENPGGVCLYRGCIPSKALLHVARVIEESRDAEAWGLTYNEPVINLDKMRTWKNTVVSKLTGGLGSLTKARKINYVKGRAAFKNSKTLLITKKDGSTAEMTFDYAVVATGSRPTIPPPLAINSPRVMDSTGALNIEDIPARLLVIGGGYIGCELGSVYAALGSKVTVVEMTGGLLMGADKDLADVVTRKLEERFHKILLKTKVLSLEDTGSTVKATLEGLHVDEPVQEFERVLISVGRRPNSDGIGLENTKIQLDERGFIKVDKQRRTAESHIFAIGDIAGDPMLAHKASHEGRVAIEAIAGEPSVFDPRAIPAVVFTDPEMAWCGLTETQAKTEGRSVKIATFPWKASGRATTLGRDDGLTKMILDPHTEQVLGVGIAGVGAGELIAEGVLAVEMAARAGDLKATIHAHPTLSETMMEAAEIFFGHGTHVFHKK